MRKWFFALSCSLALAAAEPPRCDREQRGRLWPEEANDSREARQAAIQCGELRICTRGLWRLRWEPVSVPYWKLTGDKAPLSCAAGPAEARNGDGKPDRGEAAGAEPAALTAN